jgi:hypothetical protein
MTNPTAEQLHWNHLRKQGLLEDYSGDFYSVTRDQLALHSTDYWTPYLSVWARIGDYDAKSVFESINSGKTLVRTHAFRTTVHLVHLDNLSLILSATGPSLYRKVCKDRELRLLSEREIGKMEKRVESSFLERTMTMREVKEAFPEYQNYIRSILRLLFAKGSVVRAEASHARSNLTSYASLQNWVPGFELEIADEKQAESEAIRRHLERFGPATIDDISWWLGTTKTAVKDAFESFGDEIRSFEYGGSEVFAHSRDYEIAASLELPTDRRVWFLPYEDHFLKAFIGRDSFINPDFQTKISPASPRHYWPSDPDAPRKVPSKGVRATGEIRPTIWLDGAVVGRWEIDDSNEEKEVVTSLYSKEAVEHSDQIDEVREELQEFINRRLVPIS